MIGLVPAAVSCNFAPTLANVLLYSFSYLGNGDLNLETDFWVTRWLRQCSAPLRTLRHNGCYYTGPLTYCQKEERKLVRNNVTFCKPETIAPSGSMGENQDKRRRRKGAICPHSQRLLNRSATWGFWGPPEARVPRPRHNQPFSYHNQRTNSIMILRI
jgi:hypothetical protein